MAWLTIDKKENIIINTKKLQGIKISAEGDNPQIKFDLLDTVYVMDLSECKVSINSLNNFLNEKGVLQDE